MTDSRITDYLRKYLEFGLSPIHLNGKVAAYHWKSYKFNPQDFARPGVNVGLRTGILPGGSWFYVVDVDSKDGLGKFIGYLPQDTPIVSTGKGWHLYLRCSKEVKTRHYEGLDIIGNGYVVAPPSVHKSGKPYCFVRPLGSCIPLLDPEIFIPLPIVSNSCEETDKRLAQEQGTHKHIPVGVPQGQRHTTGVRFLGILFAAHLTEEEALVQAIEWNKKNKPPMTQSEVVHTVRTCYQQWDKYEG